MTEATPPRPRPWELRPPHVDDLADHHAGLAGLPLPQLVEEELEVADHGSGPLPALLHPCRLGHLNPQQKRRLNVPSPRPLSACPHGRPDLPARGPRTRFRSPSGGRSPVDPWSARGGRDTPQGPCPHTSHGRRSYILQTGGGEIRVELVRLV